MSRSNPEGDAAAWGPILPEGGSHKAGMSLSSPKSPSQGNTKGTTTDPPETSDPATCWLSLTSIPAGTLLAFKVVPGRAVNDATFSGQTLSDWSAVYAQFSIPHAIAYLPNHFDRGHQAASLIAMWTRQDVPAAVFDSQAFRDGRLSADAKAAVLRSALAHQGIALGDGPLMQAFGEALRGVLIAYDAEELECILPHHLVTEQRFRFQHLCTILRDEQRPWAASGVEGLAAPLGLSRVEVQSMVHLGRRLADVIVPNSARAVLDLAAAV